MDWSLKLAVVVFCIALALAVAIGIWIPWTEGAGRTFILSRILVSSLFALLGAGAYIALRDALHRLRSAR